MPTPADPLLEAPATLEVGVRRVHASEGTREDVDSVAIEAPLEVRIGGKASTILMRTPGDDEDLVRGFLWSEGIIRAAADIRRIYRPDNLSPEDAPNVLAVELRFPPARAIAERFSYSSAACGVCGKTSLGALEVKGEPATSGIQVRRAVLGELPERLREAQRVFRRTGGLHASGLFTADGELVALREDVGRHNALDKLVGHAVSEGLMPLADRVLVLSGRVSYELAQKAVAAGIPFIAAVGAPSSYAIDIARRFEITLVGFLRPGSLNVYARPDRVVA